jgi:hypothetical protein
MTDESKQTSTTLSSEELGHPTDAAYLSSFQETKCFFSEEKTKPTRLGSAQRRIEIESDVYLAAGR